MIRTLIATTLGAAMAMSIALAQTVPPKIVILVGPPGSGKTTQAKFIAKKYGIPSFSVAELLIKEMKSNKAISKALAAGVAAGDVMPDDQATELIRTRVLRTDVSKGFVLDGYPATAGQAKSLDRMLQDQQMPKAVVVLLQAPDDVIRKRMLERGRADDKPEIIDRRIREFREEVALLAGWAGQTRVVRVDSTGSINQVSTQIAAGLEDAWAKMSGQRP